MNDKNVAKEILMITRTMTPRQWAKVRTVLDMSKEEIMEDSDSLVAVMAWHKDGADLAKFEDFLGKSVGDLERLVFGDDYVNELEASIDAALAEVNDSVQ